MSVLSFAALPSNAAPAFIANATLTSPTNAVYPAGPQQNPTGYYAKVSFTSTSHYVRITGGTPNGSLNVQYDLNINNQGTVLQDDFYSGLVTIDANGKFERQANGSGTMAGTASSGPTGPGRYTAEAVADIYNQADTTQKNHSSSTAQWGVN